MKKTFVILLCMIMTACVLSACSAKPQTETSTEAGVSVTSTAAATTEATTEAVTEEISSEEASSETATTDAHAYDFLQKGAWYLYNEDERTAYVFTFTDNQTAEVAFFNSDNADGLDTKYYSAKEKYEINEVEGDILLEIADPTEDDTTLQLSIQKGKLCYGKKPLVQEKKVSLETVFDHFNQ